VDGVKDQTKNCRAKRVGRARLQSYLQDRLTHDWLTTEQGQDCLWSGVGLGQRRDTGLEGNLRLGQVSSLLRQIRVANARFRCREVGQLGLCEVDRVVELILPLADVACAVPRVATAVARALTANCAEL